jgi:protein-disulfide isomerase/uncharacterized membrane protein
VTADSRISRDNQAERAARRLRGLLLTGAVAACVGVALSVVISYIHAQIEKSAGGYTSFCNVNAQINCDRVLTSPFAMLAGVPVAWLALVTYAGIAVAYLAAARSRAVGSRRFVQVACLASIGAAAVAVYMAAISIVVLETVCLMCSGLYVVSAVLLMTALLIPGRVADARPGEPRLFVRGAILGAMALSLVAVAALAAATWPSTEALPPDAVSLAELRDARPAFFDWYTSLPIVTVPPLRDGLEKRPGVPVEIIEFFDFECGHCRHSHALTTALEARRREQVQVIRRHFPLDPSCNEAVPHRLHSHACRAAEASECARLQGRFDDMADVLFSEQGRLFEENLIYQAKKLGLDMDAFKHCLDSHETLQRVIEDCRAGAKLGITSTPTLLINGRMVRGTFDEPWGYDYAVLIAAKRAAGESLAAADGH